MSGTGDEERLALIAWSRVAEPGDLEARRKVLREGPVAALADVRADEEAPGKWRVRLAELNPERDWAMTNRAGGRILVPGDEEWPAGLDDLGERAPYCLYVRGPHSLARPGRGTVAIVGARAATPYGERTAADLGAGCGERDVAVISGAAYGIDGAAHRGALAADGPTVAVIACGVDRVYPRGHEDLLGRIARQGAVVSEVPPGSSPTRWRFLERNRLIAALGRATVVVEAAFRSGANSTAKEARLLGRVVGAVPGPVSSPLSAGPHVLVRDHGAVLVTDAAEVAELAGPIGEHLEERARPVRAAVHDGLDEHELRVFDALPLRRPAPLVSVARAAGLPEGQVLGLLGRLLIEGLARQSAGHWVRVPEGTRRP